MREEDASDQPLVNFVYDLKVDHGYIRLIFSNKEI
jgi:hypothetical protein